MQFWQGGYSIYTVNQLFFILPDFRHVKKKQTDETRIFCATFKSDIFSAELDLNTCLLVVIVTHMDIWLGDKIMTIIEIIFLNKIRTKAQYNVHALVK